MPVGLSTALNTALSGLNVNQQQLAVLSQNIANANTAGYSLQNVSQHAVYLDGQGSGVSTDEVIRQVNENFINAVQQQNSTVGLTGVLSSYNNQIQTLIGQPGNSNSIDSYISTFFNNLQGLAQTPQNTALQQAAVNSGSTLATQMQSTAQGLYNLQLQADGDISNAVSSINSDLTNLSSVNHDIVTATLQGQSLAGLQDRRDSLLSDLSQYLNLQTYNNSDGSINVTTGSGTTLLDQTTTYQLKYSAVPSVTTFTSGGSLAPVQVYAVDASGNLSGTPQTLISGGVPSAVTSTISSGKLAGLVTMRDQQIPNLLDQFDTLAASLRDQVNAIENSGSGFPGANSMTGERAVGAQDYSKWSGSVQIAVLNANGQPVSSPYSDESNGIPPLNLNLSSLNTGNGAGNPSTQGIIDAINQYYGSPQNKVELGNLNNIQMVSDSDSLPGVSGQLNFDLNLDNTSGSAAKVFVSGVTVTPSSGANTATVTLPAPNIAISNYVTTSGSGSVTVNTSGSTAGLKNGETVYLSGPGTGVDGIAAGNLTGTFVISNLTGSSFTITAANGATASVGTTTAPVGSAKVTPPYVTQPAGQNSRTNSAGLFNIALGSNSSATSYTVTLNVTVDDGTGSPATSQISYLVSNNQANLLNQYYAPQTANGQGTIVKPITNQPIATAMLVDANGNELPKDNNGNYVNTQVGYLEIKAAGSTNTIAINSLNSTQLGQPANTPPIPGSNQGFSQYFALNNFFNSNAPTTTGDTVAGSAFNMSVVQNLQSDPGLISLGTLSQGTQPVSASAPPNYTYVLSPGDNSVIQKLAALSSSSINFPQSGGLGATSQTFDGYAGAIIAATSSNATTATANQTNATTLLTGYQQQSATVSGVNLDTELANTVIYQNAYAASARVITVTSTLFDTLLQSFQ